MSHNPSYINSTDDSHLRSLLPVKNHYRTDEIVTISQFHGETILPPTLFFLHAPRDDVQTHFRFNGARGDLMESRDDPCRQRRDIVVNSTPS